MSRVAVIPCLLALASCEAPGPIKVGGLGDSLTDEVGIDTGTNLKGFLEILVASGKVDCGGSGVRYGHEDPRRGNGDGGHTSYKYNFAKSGMPLGDLYDGTALFRRGYLGGGAPDYLRPGATCASPLAGEGKHSQVGSPTCPGSWGGLRQMAIDEGLDYGVMTLGGYEMVNSVMHGFPMNVKGPVSATTRAHLDRMRDKLAEGLDLVTDGKGNNMKMVLGNVFDLGGTPISSRLTETEKANIRAHVMEWNDRVAAVAAARNIPVLDWWGWWEDAVNNGVNLCGIVIDPHEKSPQDDSDLTILTSLTHDGFHPTPVGAALIANRFLGAIKTHYGQDVKLLTDQEIVALAGLAPAATTSADADIDQTVEGTETSGRRRLDRRAVVQESVGFQMTHGGRITRERNRLAPASLTNFSLVGSNFKLRLSHMQMLAAWTVDMDRCMTSALATVGRRDFTQSRKSRTWFIGCPVLSM